MSRRLPRQFTPLRISLRTTLGLATVAAVLAGCASPVGSPTARPSLSPLLPTAAAPTSVPTAFLTPTVPAPTPSSTISPRPSQSPTAPPAGKWTIHSNGNFVRGAAVLDGRVYAATEGGVVMWDAASGEWLRKWTTIDGLSDNLATSIVACSIPEPRIVVGTERGLSILDPKAGAWRKQTKSDSGMAADEVAALLCDAKAAVLVVGYDSSGIDVFDAKAGTWRHVGEKQGLASDYVNAMAVSPDGKDIWVASPFGASQVTGQAVKVYNSKSTKLASDGVSGIAVDGAGNVWWGMLEGLVRFSKGAYKTITDSSVAGFPFGTVTVLAPAGDGTLWAGTGFGDICHLDAAGQKCLPIAGAPGVTSGLNSLSVDATAGLFYATDGSGLYRFDGKNWRQYFVPGEALASNRISGIAQDNEGQIWIATDSGANRLNPAVERAAWEHITASENGLPDNAVSSVHPSPRGGVWLAAGAPALLERGRWTVLTADRGLIQEAVTSIALDGSGRAWFGTPAGISVWDGQKITSILKKDGLPDDRIQALLAEDGMVWAGTPTALLRYDGKQWQAFSERHGLPSADIIALAKAADGTLLVGTASGIATFDGKQARLIPDVVQDIVTSIATAPNGDVWVGTMAGAYRRSGGEWTRFSVAEGLPTNRIMAVFVDRSGSVWIGGDGGGVAVYRQ